MPSLVNFCLVFFVLTGNSSNHVDGLLKNYVSLISDVHEYYGTSSVFFIFSRSDWRKFKTSYHTGEDLIRNANPPQGLQDTTLVNVLCLEFSRKGVLTLMINFDKLSTRTNFYRRQIVRPLIVVMLDSVNDITEFNKSTQSMNTAYPIWLVIFADEFNKAVCEYCNHPGGNVFSLRFNTEMLIVCCHNPLLKEWWSIDTNRTEIADFATWTKDEGLRLLVLEGLYARRSSINGAGLRVAIVTKSTLIDDRGDNTFGGFGGIVIQELQRVMNFTISATLREVGFGSWSASSQSWSGVVGQLAEGKADLGVGEFTITNSRRKVVDFTWPLMLARNRLYIKVPDGSEVRWRSYIEVFRYDIWLTVLVLLITSPILLTLIKVKGGAIPCWYHIIENYLHVWGIFCQEALSHFPTETPLRIAYVSIFVSAVVTSAAYSASLISFLTVSSVSMPFSNLAGFARDRSYKLIVIQNSSNYDFFSNSTDDVLSKMMMKMKPLTHLPLTLEEGFRQVCKEKVAFFTDETVKKTMSERITCKLAEIETGNADNLAMILSPHSQYTGLVNHHIQRFQDNGMLNRLKQKYFVRGNTVRNSHTTVGIWAIVPILSVLTGGIILALVVLSCEKLYYANRINLQKWPYRINKTLARNIALAEAPQRLVL